MSRMCGHVIVLAVFLHVDFAGVQAQTFTVLHAFANSPDGFTPYGGVILDRTGNLYGTTSTGGRHKTGIIFKIDTAGTETVLHDFLRPEGVEPMDSLLLDRAGNLYGTAFKGGLGSGSVFELSPGGKFAPLLRFAQDGTDGNGPYAGLIRDGAGNLYGTAGGGNYWNGIVFKVDHLTGAETILYSFAGPPNDGSFPTGNLVRDSQGDLYGTTVVGGAFGYGTVFELDSNGTEKVLYNFTGGLDGMAPSGGVIRDSQGNLFGTAYGGGTFFLGTVFKLDANGVFSLLHTFGDSSPDGAHPYSGLVEDAAGNLCGTTSLGGEFGVGSVFELDSAGTIAVMHSFTFGSDGAIPYAGLTRDHAGNLYGTTEKGGDSNCDCGVVFKITP